MTDPRSMGICDTPLAPDDTMTRDELTRHLAAIQLQVWPNVADIEHTPAGPRCCDCSRLMRRWGNGYACGCGAAIDKEGHDDGKL